MQLQASNALAYNQGRQAPSFATGDLVLVDCLVLSNAALGWARKLVKHFREPFQVSEVLSSDRYNIVDITTSKRMQNIHAFRIKPFYANEDIDNANPQDVVSPESATVRSGLELALSSNPLQSEATTSTAGVE
ncbi:hypothetical protein F4703DRAFT_1852553 [Phycomyces blakesleeanus]